MQPSVLQARLLDYLATVGSARTDEIALACSKRIDQVAASLNSLCTQGPAVPIRQQRERKSAQYTTWYYTQPIKESTVLTLTSLQDRLFAHMLSLPLGDARSDVLARAVDSCPSSVASSLLTLRSQGIVGSANDGGHYNFWFVTDKGKAELNKRAAFLREQEEQARREEAQRVAAATKERLLQAQRDREAKAALAKMVKPTPTMNPVKDALHKAMHDKGFDPINNPKYIVWSPSASVPPKVQYATHDEAVRVAGIMAQRFPKQVFIVCELQDVVLYTPPVQQAGQLLRGTL